MNLTFRNFTCGHLEILGIVISNLIVILVTVCLVVEKVEKIKRKLHFEFYVLNYCCCCCYVISDWNMFLMMDLITFAL